MSTLTPAQIAGVAQGAGFTGAHLRTAVAVALAESGGRTDVVNTNRDGSRDRGLWQINSRWHPEVTDAQAFDPAGCAKAAYAISKAGTNWTPWATYTSGVYAAQLGRASAAAAQPAAWILPTPNPMFPGIPLPGGPQDLPSLPGVGALDGIGKSMAVFGSLAIHAGQWVANPHNWLRVAFVTAGAGAAIAGLVLLADSGVGGPVGAAAGAGKKLTDQAAGVAGKAAMAAAV